MSDKTILVSDSCGTCKRLLKALEQNGVLSKYRVIDVNAPEGKDVAVKLGVNAIPECIVIAKDGEGEKARLCTEEEIKKILEDKGQS